jgi:hypothetical protein
MRLDKIIQALLPHDEKFYGFFEDAAQCLIRTSELMKQLTAPTFVERENVVRQIHEQEHQCDAITHKIFGELNATFVTPFDREDIHHLASALDDVLDYMDGSAGRFVLYKLKECPDDMLELIDIIHRQVQELQVGISSLRHLDRPERMRQVIEKINELENQGDAIFEESVARLFEVEKDPIQIIKLKEIYVGLETATDKCEDAANVLESLLIKHA